MARPPKDGCDYLPLDVDFFSDKKIKFVASRFHEKGVLIVLLLLCEIYREGYAISWSDDEAALFAESAGKNITPGLAKDVVQELLKREFFDEDMYMRFSILTSFGIQKRYATIKKDSGGMDKIREEHQLIELSGGKPRVFIRKTAVFPPNNTIKESKEKESKGKKNSAPVFPFDEDVPPTPNSTGPPQVNSGPFKITADLQITATALEAAQRNQYTLTGEKNTEFILEQWKIFLLERMNSPKYYADIGQLTSHFLNWIRTKKPEKKQTHEQPASQAKVSAQEEQSRRILGY